jgi:hypothetical protein
MRNLLGIVALVLLLFAADLAEAGCRRGRHRGRFAGGCSSCSALASFAGSACSGGACRH